LRASTTIDVHEGHVVRVALPPRLGCRMQGFDDGGSRWFVPSHKFEHCVAYPSEAAAESGRGRFAPSRSARIYPWLDGSRKTSGDVFEGCANTKG
jgi:hypothetical protein